MRRRARFLFVYGTLMRGFHGAPGWHRDARARYAGRGRVKGRLYDMGAYPAAVFAASSGDYVHGELYELRNPAALERLDQYESAVFLRRLVEVLPEEGPPVTAWAYSLNRPAPAFRLIPGGDYRLA
jgi:gamma-glutamylcyclotransferase (GGCT)/AIG2-like uncharacterized protein YtfP